MTKVWWKKSDRQIIGDRHIDGYVAEILILEEMGGDKAKKERGVREERWETEKRDEVTKAAFLFSKILDCFVQCSVL